MTTRVGPVQVGVVGAGTMGVGIVLVMLSAGHKVVVQDVDDASVARGIDQVRRFLDRSLSKGKLTEIGHDDALNRLTGKVTDIVYQGESLRVFLQLADGTSLSLRQPSHYQASRLLPPVGGELTVTLHPEDTIVVPKTPE